LNQTKLKVPVAAKPKTAIGPSCHVAIANHDQSADSDSDDETNATDQSKWFSGPQWTKIFIPSLSEALYVAQYPFDDFKKDSPQFIKTVQDIFALLHPEIIYKIHAKDKFIEKVRPIMITCTL
jgi:hypothetical protein